MTEEKLTIYDAFNKPIGSADRSEVHTKGFWHRSVNFIVIDPKKRTVIFQDSKALNDFNVEKFFVKMNGGHAHGEDMDEEVERELEEEMGLKAQVADSVHFLGVYQVSFEPASDFINHEFMYFYITAFSDAFEKIKMDGIEVKSIFEINIDETIDLLVDDRDIVSAVARDASDKTITLDFTKKYFKNFTDDSLYLRLFLSMQDFCNGRNKKHIVI